MSYMGEHDPSRLTMGRYSYGDPTVLTYDRASEGRVEIGNFCSVAAGVTFLIDGEHIKDLITTHPLQALAHELPLGHNRSKGPILVGHDVWIGRGATILSNVRIDTGAIVGAFSVVAHDVAPYVIVAGNPAQPVGRRFTVEEAQQLLETEWWEWPDEKIQAAASLLHDRDVKAFLEYASKSTGEG